MMRLISGILMFCALTGAAYADCNPKEFLISDINKYTLSDKVKMSAYSVIDKSADGKSSFNAGATIPIKGLPVNVTMNEAKQYSRKVLAKSGYSLDSSYNLSVVNTALSSVGADMYANCLGARNVKVTIPAVAFDSNEFFMKVKWAPAYVNNGIGEAQITLTNGLIGSENNLTTTFKSQEEKVFKVTNKSSLNTKSYLQIAVTIDGQSAPIAVIPPPTPIARYKFVERRGQASIPVPSCTDQAYLVSERGSSAGYGAKTCTLCVIATDEGVILPSTAKLHAKLSARGAYAKVDDGNDTLRTCATFNTSGAGKGSGRFEVGLGSTFNVFEAVPF